MKRLMTIAIAVMFFAGCQSAGRQPWNSYSPSAVDYGGAVSAGTSTGACPSCH